MPRRAASMLALATLLLAAAPAAAQDLFAALAGGGHVAFMRHALAPGGGDPKGFRLGDCATQRNLNDAGRDQARRIGDELRRRGVAALRLYTSEWCRCIETARLLGFGPAEPLPALNSLWDDRHLSDSRTAEVRAFVDRQPRTGPSLMLVGHGTNISFLTGIDLDSGGIAVARLDPTGYTVLGVLPVP